MYFVCSFFFCKLWVALYPLNQSVGGFSWISTQQQNQNNVAFTNYLAKG